MKWLVFTLLILGLGCNAAQAQKSAVTCIWHYNPDHVTLLPHSDYGKVAYYIYMKKLGYLKNYRVIRYVDVPWREDEVVPLLPYAGEEGLPLPEGYCIGAGETSVEEKEVLIREFKENEFVMPFYYLDWATAITGTPSWSGFHRATLGFHKSFKKKGMYTRGKYYQYPLTRIQGKTSGRYSWLTRTKVFPFRYHADEGKLYMLTSLKTVTPITKRTDMPQYKYIYKDSVAHENTKEDMLLYVKYYLDDILYPGYFYDYVANYGQPKPELEKPEIYARFGKAGYNYLKAFCRLPEGKGKGELVVTTVGGGELERYPLETTLNYIEIATKSVPEVVLTLYVNGEEQTSLTCSTNK